MDLHNSDSKVKANHGEPRLEATREQWQRQIMADPDRQPNYALVAVAISWHLNRNTGDAWPAFATLAKETGLGQRTVVRAVKWLEARGHMSVAHSRGGNISNRYRPILISSGLGDIAAEVSSGLGDIAAMPNQTLSSGLGGTRTSNEPLNNLLESASKQEASEKASKQRRRKPETPLPDNWTPSVASFDKAKHLGLSDLDITRELEKFCNHARQNDRRCRNWDAAADNWMINAADFRGLKPKEVAPTNGAVLSFPALPGSPQWQAWRTQLRDMDSPESRSMVRELDRRELEGRPFNFATEWPPGHTVAA